MADFLEDKRAEIASRLSELKPIVEEYRRLEEAVAALFGVAADYPARQARSTTRPRRRATGRSSRSAAGKRVVPTTRRSTGTRGSRRVGAARAAEALTLVQRQPGITATELAKGMGVKRSSLYRVLSRLSEEEMIYKKGRGWAPLPGGPGTNPPPTRRKSGSV